MCPECKGTGKYVGLNVIEPCRACSGFGVPTKAKPIEVKPVSEEVYIEMPLTEVKWESANIEMTEAMSRYMKSLERYITLNLGIPFSIAADCMKGAD